MGDRSSPQEPVSHFFVFRQVLWIGLHEFCLISTWRKQHLNIPLGTGFAPTIFNGYGLSGKGLVHIFELLWILDEGVIQLGFAFSEC